MSFYCDSRRDEFLSGSVAHCYCSYYSYPNFPYVYPVFEPDYNLGLGPREKSIAKCNFGKYPCVCCEKCHRSDKLRFAESEAKKERKDAFTETEPFQNKGVSSNECDVDNEALLAALTDIKSCVCKTERDPSSHSLKQTESLQKRASSLSLGSTRSRSPSILKKPSIPQEPVRKCPGPRSTKKIRICPEEPVRKCPGPRSTKKIRICPGPRKIEPEEIPEEKSPSPIKKSPSPPPHPPHKHTSKHDHSSKLIKRLKAIDTLKNLSSFIASHPVTLF